MLVPLSLSLSVLCYVPSLGGVAHPSLGGAAQTPAIASRAAVSLISMPWRAKNQKKSEPEVTERRQLRTVLQSFSRDDVLWPGASELVSEFMTPSADLLMLLRKRLRRVIALRFTRSASPMATAPSSPMQLSVSQSVFSTCQ